MRHSKDFGYLLRDIRLLDGLTQKGLAEILNVPIATVRGWEQAYTMPTGTNWGKIKERYKGQEAFTALEQAYITEKRQSRV